MAFTWTIWEFIDMLIMIGAIGYIFHDVFRLQPRNLLEKYLKKLPNFAWGDFWFACSVVAPAILLHELGHKTSAVLFGLDATFHAAYFWLVIGIVLKLLNFGFIFFVPAFVSISGNATPLQDALVAFAGPAVNMILWLIAWVVLKNYRSFKLSPKMMYYFQLSKRINLFLFIFNLIPIPGFDGFSFFTNMIKIVIP